jgi:phosphoserine phosphatase
VSRFRSVVLDVDSTVAGIEGIDWLADLRSPDVAAEVARLTERAMAGLIPLEEVYSARLAAIDPLWTEVEALAAAYQACIAPDAGQTLALLRAHGVGCVLISGGLREALLPLAESLGFRASEVQAVPAWRAESGHVDIDTSSPLIRSDGKLEVLRALQLARPILAVGDGMTDLAMRDAADAFAAFTGFARRAAVVERADYEISTFVQLASLVLGDPTA